MDKNEITVPAEAVIELAKFIRKTAQEDRAKTLKGKNADAQNQSK